jgi:magnesium-transporting ATPase (P-type)
MIGDDFRRKVGGYILKEDGRYYIGNNIEFKRVVIDNNLKVIARANPEDKLILSVGLMDLGHTVAVTGEGINDVPALENSHVGFCMGSGVSAAKQASKMILVDDNINSIINAVLWGRNIYGNVRKFLQFQLTFNVTTILIVFMGAIFRGATLFSVVELMWLNLIMDTLAALSLASERPNPSVIADQPVKENENLITRDMWKQIVGMSLYISGVMFIMFWFNEDFWSLNYSMSQDLFENGNPTDKCRAFTMLFNLFVYLHLFNQLNCREITAKRTNPFKNITRNFQFLLVFFSTIGVQYMIVEWGGVVTRTSGLTSRQHAFSVIIGSSSLVASYMIKKLPDVLTDRLVPKINDATLQDDQSKIMSMYKKQANSKMTDIKAL